MEHNTWDEAIKEIEGLRNLKDGWLDGKGKKHDDKDIDWLLNSFKSFYNKDAIIPSIYPIIEGVGFEWEYDNRKSAEIFIDISTHQGRLYNFDEVGNNMDEYDYDLNKESSWKELWETWSRE